MSKLALITGGAKRIGKGIALSLAENGFDVVIHYSESRKEAEAVSYTHLTLPTICSV